jgi:hypothetical protein
MNHYRDNPHVMSVTGWTHPRVIPSNVANQPYFDGRAECWVWGAWSRSWIGMEKSAMELILECGKRKIDIYRYGADLYRMAKDERKRNTWAVRFSYLHILNKGLCLRPPYSLVQNLGFGENATNTIGISPWQIEEFGRRPIIPGNWPAAEENLECPALWQKAYGTRPTLFSRGAQLLRESYWVWREKAKKITFSITKSGRRHEETLPEKRSK